MAGVLILRRDLWSPPGASRKKKGFGLAYTLSYPPVVAPPEAKKQWRILYISIGMLYQISGISSSCRMLFSFCFGLQFYAVVLHFCTAGVGGSFLFSSQGVTRSQAAQAGVLSSICSPCRPFCDHHLPRFPYFT
jgi:hypothetical protein